ncbi:hypothetical protein JCM19379_22790 [Methyloparacoccus murrellii]
MKKYLNHVQQCLAYAGLAVLDCQTIYELEPWSWPHRVSATLDSVHPLKLAHALIACLPGLHFIECDLAGRRVLVAARSLLSIEDRLETLTGHRPAAIKEVKPTTAAFLEQTRVPEVKQPLELEFPPDFDPEAFAAAIPRHDCPRRVQMTAKLRRWHELNPA